jgi:RNA polymerase sigma-70 factor (ECF subfamily)
MSEAPDRDLWRRAHDGDGEAFGLLFERHSGPIYNYCFRRTADWALAEDLTSATFLLAWRGLRRAPLLADSALPLLYGIATNVLRNQRRSLKRGREAFGRLALPRVEEPDFAEETGARLDDQAAMRELLLLFSRLPRREQDVLALCEWSGLSYEDRPRSTSRSGPCARGWPAAAAGCGNSLPRADPNTTATTSTRFRSR